MLAKFGLLLLMLLCGAMLFVAGTLAPEPVATPVRAAGQKLVVWFAGEDAGIPESVEGTASAEPIPYSSLIPPAGAEERRPYGLQVGLYGSLAEADEEALKLTANNIEFALVPVQDKSGMQRQLLVAGPFETRSQAQFLGAQLPRMLGAHRPLEVVLFPQQ